MIYSADATKKYPCLTAFLKVRLPLITKNSKIWTAFLRYSQLSETRAKRALNSGANPCLEVVELPRKVNGRFRHSKPNKIFLDKTICDKFETDRKNPKAKLLIESTVLHEMVHWGDYMDRKSTPKEEGKLFEKAAYGRDIKRYW